MSKTNRFFGLSIIIVVLLICFNCEDELNIEPTGAITPDIALSSEENVLNLLVGAYSESIQQFAFGGNSQIFADLLGYSFDEVSYTGGLTYRIQVFFKDIEIDNVHIELHFLHLYEMINQVNLVIDNLDVISSSNETRQKAEGEAKFLRAMAYFDLVRLYGLPYSPSGTNSQPGVPLQLTGIIDFNEDLAIARNTVEENYSQIISDLTDAISLLPNTNAEFADKYAAKALLARVYLQQGNYMAALNASHDVIENSGHFLVSNYREAFNNDSGSPEDIYSLQITAQDNVPFLIWFHASQENGGFGGDLSVDSGYLNLFDDPENDERANFFYISPNNGLLLTSKYTNQFANISYIRLAEMHLIRAESNFRLGLSTGMDPLEEINLLRARSNASPLIALTLDLIYNERRLELGFEGHLIHDIKRTQGSVEGYPYNANNLVFPIPQAEMNANPLMVQNPGY